MVKSERLRLAKHGQELEKAGKPNPFKIYEAELIEYENSLKPAPKGKGKDSEAK